MGNRKAGSVITTIILLAICIALAGAVIIKLFEPEEAVEFGHAPTNTGAKSNVYVDEVAPSNFVKAIKFYGTVSDDSDTLSIITRAGGYVSEVLVSENDRVEEGQVIGYIDPSTPGASYKKYAVTAKVSGVVKSVSATVGSYLAQGSVFATEKEEAKYIVKVNVPEKYIDYIHLGSRAVLSSSIRSDLSTNAYITDISTKIDSSTRTVAVELTADDSSLFLDGLALTVRLVTEEEFGVFTVPSDAVYSLGDKNYVYVVANDKAEIRDVTTGSSNDTDTIILSGLQYGDKVIVEGTVSEGASVNIVER